MALPISVRGLRDLTFVEWRLSVEKILQSLDDRIARTGGVRGVPSGTFLLWGTNTAPDGYVIADGTAVSRTTYAALFALYGTTYGAGNGTTTFNLPDLRGRVPVGRHTGQTEFDTLAETGGSRTHTLGISEIPAHNHDVPTDFGPSSMQHMSGATGRVAQTGTGAAGAANPLPLTGNTGGGGAHNNLQPYLVLNYIIKT